MNKVLVAFFSATGTTKRAAEEISTSINADIFEIEPVDEYTSHDLDWTDKTSRSTREMEDKRFRPKIKESVNNLEEYDKVIIGFPVWWYTAPTIINTFIESNALEGKEIYIFVTSGGSGYEGSLNDLKNTYTNLNIVDGVKYNSIDSIKKIMTWVN